MDDFRAPTQEQIFAMTDADALGQILDHVTDTIISIKTRLEFAAIDRDMLNPTVSALTHYRISARYLKQRLRQLRNTDQDVSVEHASFEE